ncbi:ABC transporter ATP-binding protein [Litorimonas sp. RW-G-Af-16]|uniref:ABC transporter ATP-binding protein n=1 Tax=Litorimonas sp. RW-G-Af-16 TaxID=3241168 RepID=UPI00390C4906
MSSISLKNVSVSFPIYTGTTRSLRQEILSTLGGKISAHAKTTYVDALHDITMEIEQGDRLGIIGHNGAGKTTLLRVLSGIYPPSSGEIKIDGEVTTLTDVSLGMDVEATGWQNIIFRSVMMGKTYKEARELSPAIAEFSELGEFLDLPVRTYSTGMFMRLAFAISTAFTPDILVLDELIGAGDAAFQTKSLARLQGLLDESNIIVISSHNLGIIKSHCTKALYLGKGSVIAMGGVEEVLEQHRVDNA